MANIFKTSKWLSIAVGCAMVLTEGIVLSFSSWANKLKDTFNMTQTQVEIIGSIQNLGMEATLIGGVTLENHGYICTGLVALVSGGVPYIFNIVISLSPEIFDGTVFILMAILFMFIGIGIGTNYIFALTISLKNISCASGGKLVAILTISMYGSSSLISLFSSTSNSSFTAYLAIFTVLHIFTSLLGLFCLREVVHKPAETKEENSTEAEKDKNSEKTALTPKSKNIHDYSSYYGDQCGFGIMKITDFWLLAFSFLISISIDKTFFMNTGTYLRSFGLESHLQLVTTTGPLVALGFKACMGPVTDACRHCVSRICFFIIPAILKFGTLILFLFFGDNFVVLILTTYISYISFGAMFLIGPVLFGEYFGMKYYGRNFGTSVFASGVVTVILHVLLGLLYDSQTSDSNVTCLGLQCFYGSTVILIVLNLITLCTSIALWKRTPKPALA